MYKYLHDNNVSCINPTRYVFTYMYICMIFISIKSHVCFARLMYAKKKKNFGMYVLDLVHMYDLYIHKRFLN